MSQLTSPHRRRLHLCAAFVGLLGAFAVAPRAEAQINNPSFTTGTTAQPSSTYPANPSFAQGRQVLSVALTPTTYSLTGANVTQTSSPFTVPANAQSLRLEFLTGNVGDGFHAVPLYVEVLTGTGYSIVNRIDEDVLWRSLNQGWGQATLNIQPFAGQSVQLRFRSWNNGNAHAQVRSISFNVEVPSWTLSSGRFAQVLGLASNNTQYLSLWGANQSATSQAFTVPANGRTVRFQFMTGNIGDGNHSVPLYVEVLHGTGYATVTRIDEDTAWRSLNQGWYSAVLNLQDFIGQSVRLRFRTWNNGNALAGIKQITLNDEVPGWTPSNAGWVLVSSMAAPPDPGPNAPSNTTFATGLSVLSTRPANPDFTSGLTPSGLALTPASFTLTGANVTQNLGSFTVPATAQSLRFRHLTGNTTLSSHVVPLYVEVLTTESGVPVVTRIDEDAAWSSFDNGWRQVSLSLVAFQGKTITIRFRSWNNGAARSSVDSITVQTEVPDWVLSNGRLGQVVNPGNGNLALHLLSANQTATSAPFTVPVDAQTLRFTYMTGNSGDPVHSVPLYVEVLSDEGYSTVTRIDGDTSWSSLSAGWKTAIMDVQVFRNRSVRLRFRTWNNGNARAWIDSISFHVETPGWSSSHGARARVESVDGRSGPYLWLEQADTQAVSAPFRVPSTIQFVTFDYTTGNAADVLHSVPLYVEVLSGPNYVTVSRIDGDTTWASLSQGWKTARLDVSAFQGRTVMLRFRTWNNGSARAKIDNVAFQAGVAGPARGPEANPNGTYLLMLGADRTATTTAFQVPSQSPRLTFKFQTGNIGDGNHSVPLYVEALSGAGFTTVLRVDQDRLWRKLNDAWQDGSVALDAYAGQTIRVRFRSWNNGNARVRLDEVGVGFTGGGPGFFALPFTAGSVSNGTSTCTGFELGQAFGRTCFAYNNQLLNSSGAKVCPTGALWNMYAQTDLQHSGLDFTLPFKTPLYAVTSGTVVCAGQGNCYWPAGTPGAGATMANGTSCWDANCCPPSGSSDWQYFPQGCSLDSSSPLKHRLVIRTGDYFIIYGHTYVTVPSLTIGAQVSAGQLLGYSGSANGAHLHYEIRDKDNNAYDPAPFFAQHIRDAMTQYANPLHFCQGDFGNQATFRLGTSSNWQLNGCTPNPRQAGATAPRCANCSAGPNSIVCLP